MLHFLRLLAVVSGAVALAGADSRTLRRVAPFALEDAAGKRWALAELKGKKAIVVVFLGTECPVNNAYLPRLAELHKEYEPKGVQFLAVNSNCQDTPPRVAAHAREHGIPFPVLKDAGNVVADQFAARRTPEAFVLDAAGKVLYQGRIDDQYGVGYKRPAPTRRDLAVALDEVLAGKPVSRPLTDVAGCIIARARKPSDQGPVTFSKHVAPLLQKHCQECHRPGQVGPMSLLTYKNAVAWSEMIREVVAERRMPPWHADPHFGTFANDRSLSAAERATLLAWIDGGCPPGDPNDMPPPRTFPTSWNIGKPDAVFTMTDPFQVPADAGRTGVPYQNCVVPTNFTEDRWVQAAEARPGNRAVVHHIIVFAVPPGQKEDPDHPDGIGRDLLVAFAPGELPAIFPAGAAKKIPRGSSLIFQMHYTPNGVAQSDRSSVALIFAKEPPRRQVHTRAIMQEGLEIPAGAAKYEATAAMTFERRVEVLSLMPHMHLRGKDFAYRVVYPDGKKETLLSVPRYDFGWQSYYHLVRPLRLPAGARIECTAHYDNSAANPNNPDPTRPVRWGDQTWEEMMIGFLDYTYVEGKPVPKPR
jgi:peroxiredoxin